MGSFQRGDSVVWDSSAAGNLIYNGRGPFRIVSIREIESRCNCNTLAPWNHWGRCNVKLREGGIRRVVLDTWPAIICFSDQIQSAHSSRLYS